jgi:hypothetical protein
MARRSTPAEADRPVRRSAALAALAATQLVIAGAASWTRRISIHRRS